MTKLTEDEQKRFDEFLFLIKNGEVRMVYTRTDKVNEKIYHYATFVPKDQE